MLSQSSMTSTGTSEQDHGSVTTNRGKRLTGQKRVRTGCFTCRKRRKKCDEHRPTCLNCQKTVVVCEGYPKQRLWRSASTTNTPHRSLSEASVHNIEDFPQSPNGSADFTQWESLPTQTYNSQVVGQLEVTIPLGDATFMLGEFGGWDMNGATLYDQGMTYTNSQQISLQTSTNQITSPTQAQAITSEPPLQRTFIPIELPFIITGVDGALQQNMFCHFVNTTSKFLTTLSGQSNPFNQIVIPMAMNDQTLMKTLLCLAGSHLLKVQPNTMNAEMATERSRLHDDAVRTQTQRVQDLQQASGSLRYRESVLATSLLLCLYEICEGTSTNTAKKHLETAREIITMGSVLTNSLASINTDINPFLLEFFLYHDSLATVTSTACPIVKPQFHSVSELPNQNITLIGVQDGLIQFINQISALRAEAETNRNNQDGTIIVKALSIWRDLNNWKPKSPMSKERNLFTEFYRWALFIWLFSIIFPDGKAHPKVQNAVQTVTTKMYEINSGDGVMACLLFPLFVIGSAAITVQDRGTVLVHFKKLRNWSKLGNIDVTENVVRKMWVDYDDGVVGSWDWIKSLESHEICLLVT